MHVAVDEIAKARSHTLAMARLKLVADTSATRMPTIPLVSRSASSPGPSRTGFT
ncbi:hypothetical protein [Streptomyces sp. NBC_01353]|uniref:hypothetical protein n=1 Tax=Streptomyces sp. NBC_01353 TaxID=2903835 RepID=UPI002E3666A7|nr:hypothetical protein [Streptomyces sp. NBC_01353]